MDLIPIPNLLDAKNVLVIFLTPTMEFNGRRHGGAPDGKRPE